VSLKEVRRKREAEVARVRIRAHAGIGPEGLPEVDAYIEQARAAGCRYYDEYTKFIHARLGVERK
jgi:hypothetical protein